MAILEIKKFNDPVLRKKCKEVRKIDKKTKKLVVDIVQTMKKNQGVGLAAPQIGISKRAIAVQTDLKDQRILVLVNPKILKKSKEIEMGEEGCLSFPDIFLKIKRAQKIEIDGLDINGKKIRIKAQGLLARVFQHDIDHLDGILFFNQLNFIKKIVFKLKHLSVKL